jgi:hypothetical protein
MHLDTRTDCIEHGHTDERLALLAEPHGDVAVIAAPLSTWFGKEVARRPSAFVKTIASLLVPTRRASSSSTMDEQSRPLPCSTSSRRIAGLGSDLTAKWFLNSTPLNARESDSAACTMPASS